MCDAVSKGFGDHLLMDGLSFTVPPGAVRPSGSGGDGLAIWIVDPASGTVALRTVMTGRVLSSGIEIKDGLSEGEWVVTAGINSLVEGQKVRLPDASAGVAQ